MKPLLFAASPLLLLLLLLLLPFALSLTLQEDDLVFDDVGEPSSVSSGSSMYGTDEYRDRGERKHERSRENKKHNVERLWGIPDTSVAVGHVFKMRILKQAFSGIVDHFEASGINDRSLAHWLEWDEAAATLVGIPSKKDLGLHHVSIRAFGRHGDVAKDLFTINVIAEPKDEIMHKDGKTHCDESEDQTILTIFLDAKFDGLKPSVRVNAVENLAGFLGLHTSAFSMHPHSSRETPPPDTSVILSGPGNVKHRRERHSTTIQWQVGCDGRLWHHQTDLVKQLRDQAKDGTLAEVIQQPVLLWRVRTDSSSLLRNRRETGSGNFNVDDENYDYNYEDYEDENEAEDGDDDDEIPTEQPLVKSNVEDLDRPHRHHHGDKTLQPTLEEFDEEEIFPSITRTLTSPNNYLPIIPFVLNETTSTTMTTPAPPTTIVPAATVPSTTTTTTTTTGAPTTLIATSPSTTTTTTTTTATPPTTEPTKLDTTEAPKERIEKIDITVATIPSETTIIPPKTTILQTSVTNSISTSSAPVKYLPETTVGYEQTIAPSETTEERTEEQPTTMPPPSSPVTTPAPTTTPTTTTTTMTTTTTTTTTTTQAPETTTERQTTQPRITAPPAAFPVITEKIEIEQRNFLPRQDRILPKLQVTAGKPLIYVIPEDSFVDIEDGNTRQLKLQLLRQGVEVPASHWLQFDSEKQEVYGLPLENDISIWDYQIVAKDSEGLNATANLDVHVQQHPQTRSVNHKFVLYLKRRVSFRSNVDWELMIIRSLAKFYGDPNPNQITVNGVHIEGHQAIFTWSNDSLPRSNECPKDEIDKLFNVLVKGESRTPSIFLQEALGPKLEVVKVIYQGVGQCEEVKQPEQPRIVTEQPQLPKINQWPVPRNQVDRINATVGQLLLYTVPEDTAFDFEDGSARNLKMSLLTKDRTAIPKNHWLQFDSKNQQFYGVPQEADVGRTQYHLTVTDKAGASITDGLIIVVNRSTTTSAQRNVEFSMTLTTPYDSFAHSADTKRKFVEKLQELFGDKDTSAISLDSFTGTENTVVTWHNRSLVTSYCPHTDINQLHKVLVKDDKELTDRVYSVMGSDFVVQQISVTPTGRCLGELNGIHSPSVIPPSEDTEHVGKSHDDLIITFIVPAIIIAAMLVLAGIIACVLYRRKRSGKMSVSEQDDERQSFRNKGIPVIFQDELDEKPDPGNKSPVILKEEKPPLPPPEYQKTEDGADIPMLQSENSEEPYQPPPPFATSRDNNRQNRPKPTPTYRKPPPYVPP